MQFDVSNKIGDWFSRVIWSRSLYMRDVRVSVKEVLISFNYIFLKLPWLLSRMFKGKEGVSVP